MATTKLCNRITQSGRQCRNPAQEGKDCCKLPRHQKVCQDENYKMRKRETGNPALDAMFAQLKVSEDRLTNLRKLVGRLASEEHYEKTRTAGEQRRQIRRFGRPLEPASAPTPS